MKKKNINLKRHNDNDGEFGEKYVSTKWYNELPQDPTTDKTVTEQILIELKEEAKKVHDNEVAVYNNKNAKSNSDYRWMKTMMSKGTVSDKIAAYTVAIQDNPVCNLDTLRNLVGLVKVGKKKECIAVIETLTELFLEDLLIPTRKLRVFHQRPLALLNELSSGNAVTRRKYLCNWYFEDQLKEIYTTFVLALNTAAHDTVESNKEKAISAMYKLLAGNPEQEKNLLSYIVNKLGDPSQKVASKAIYCLTQLLHKHSNMQGVVLADVEKLLFRTNISTKAQYYGLCFLSQFYLNHESPEIARRLIEVYFSFFKACIKKGDVDSRMMSALLMGVNRAYPYAKMELSKISEHIDTMYKVVHLANFNVALHALCLLYQVSDYANNVNDRFYSALYKKLFDPKISCTTHQAMLLNLVYKALLRDTEVNRVKMFVKRLLQVSVYSPPCFACGILFLVSQLIAKKREVQAVVLKKSSINTEMGDDSDEEKYEDVKEETDEVKEDSSKENDPIENTNDNEIKENKPEASWFHSANAAKDVKHKNATYNPLSRNPLYGGGEFCAYTELMYLRTHFHPSVSLFAENVLNGQTINYSGDPLKDFTLVRFLDRFVFKNPKKDIAQAGAHPTFGRRKLYRPKGVKSMQVNSAEYLNERQQNIPVDEMFLYTYLQKKYQEKKERGEDEDGESDLESVASEEFEEMLEKMSGIPKDDEDLDYMNEIGQKLKNKKGKKKGEEEEEQSDEEFSEDDDIDDDSLGEENDEDEDSIGNDLEDDDLSDVSFDSDGEDINDKTNKNKKFKKKKSGDDGSLFASAEEFASLLEDEGQSSIAPGGSNVVSNKDNANAKQLVWEEKRNRWLSGFDKAMGKKKSNFAGKGHKGSGFKRKFNGPNKFGNKSKKQRKT